MTMRGEQMVGLFVVVRSFKKSGPRYCFDCL
jgi:hypothetical protein